MRPGNSFSIFIIILAAALVLNAIFLNVRISYLTGSLETLEAKMAALQIKR